MDHYSILDETPSLAEQASASSGIAAANAVLTIRPETDLWPGDEQRKEQDAGQTLSEMARADLDAALQLLADRAQYITGATGAAIALRRGNEIVCRARTGRTAPDIGVRLQTDSGLSAECVRTGEVLLCDDAESNPRVDWATCRRMGVRSILVAPLRHFRRTLGVFEVLSSTPHAFDNNDVATMQFLSGMMVAAISRLSSLQPVAPVASGE